LALTALSARERQVAELVAAGMTNRQIAGELVVSEKTVESHLGHIFVKLDVLSRASVAAAVAQRQPEPGEPAGDPRGRSLASPVDDKRPVRPPGRPPARR
jgi:DNA-binding CsgD family transcriptional regulator